MRTAIAALVDLDGGPVGLPELQQVAAAARLPWGGGSPTFLLADGVGLLAIPVSTATPSAVLPVADAAPRRWEVVLDGTLDNRAELARDLGLPAAAAGPGGETHLVAAACERWGSGAVERFVGDFAFLLWDRAERRLLAARDAFGLRELFYRQSGRRLAVASQLQMLGRPSIADLDEEYVADFLAVHLSIGSYSPFKSVSRLPAGHQLTVATGRLATRPFWDSDDRASPPGRTAGDNAERFLALFQEGVARSLETGGRVWAELSGGLDSSSIVCVAHEILAPHPARARDFATVSFVWDETPRSDERQWSEAVVRQHHLTNHQIRCDDLFFDDAAAASLLRNEPHFGIFTEPIYRAQTEMLRDAGVQVLLSGARAESVVLGDAPPVHLADLLRALRLGPFVRELLRWQRGLHRPLANLLLDFALRPLFERDFHAQSSTYRRGLDAWVAAPFAERLGLRRRARSARLHRRLRSSAQQFQYTRLHWSEQMVSRGRQEWACEVRHPFLYRPLVELALAIPWEEKVSPELGKVLLRRAMQGRLPEVVRTRKVGAGPGPSAYKAYARRWATIEPLVRSSLLVEMGFLDRAAFTRAAELARFGMSERFVAFTSCLAFEVWLRAVTGEPGPAAATPAANDL